MMTDKDLEQDKASDDSPPSESPVEAAEGELVGNGPPELPPVGSAEIDQYKPSAADLEVDTGLPPDETMREVVLAFDRADEEQILDELQGRMLDAYLYDFSEGGKRYTDLSYAGVREVARTANREAGGTLGIGCHGAPTINEVTEDGTDYYRVVIQATDRAGNAQWGTAVEPKRMKVNVRTDKQATRFGVEKGGVVYVWDKFALTKALNKAQRNAIKAILPVPLIEAMKAKFLKQEDRVKQIQRGVSADDRIAQLPPPLTDEAATTLRDAIEAAYKELQSLNRTAITPQLYQSYLQRSAHSHEELERFLGWLQNMIETAKEKP